MNRFSILALPVLMALAACNRAPEAPTQAAAPAQAPADQDAPAAPSAGVVQATAERPALALPTVDGGRYDLAEHRGKWVVVNFWATWCAPCLKEMPELSALHTMRDNIEVVGLAYEDIEPAQMQAFLKEHPVSYPIAILDTYDPPKDFATPRGLPMTYLIDPDGKVAKQFLGPVTAHDIEAAVAAAGGKAG
ncbi:TlpA family protein disulfide reductase [[Pseudomonas] boreopolis]|uniref:Thioredoxin n=1 Tax=Xanthomonas boreopolis TaxID=86183 RepID=A0A919FA37_9XANT|nr:thioredoxin [[Pseudomonas] boreopolis]